jgi:hypothetical protein
MNSMRDLAMLIHGLSKREKTDFEKYATRQGGGRQYMKVYKVLDRIVTQAELVTEIPDEAMLTLRVRTEVKAGNVTAYGNYLGKIILRSLRNSNEFARKEDEILQNIYNAKILARRVLFEAAILSMEEAYEMAIKYAYHSLAIQALRELVNLQGQRDSKFYAEKIRERLNKINELSELKLQESQYFCLHHRAFLLTRNRTPINREGVVTELDELKQHPLLSEIAESSPFFSQVYFWRAKASLAHMENQIETALECSKNIVALWHKEAYQHLQQEHPHLYIMHLHNLITFATGLKLFDQVEHYLNIMEQFPCPNFDDRAEQFQNVLFSRQLMLLNTNRLQEAINEVTGKLKDIEGQYGDKINTARLISIYYNTLVACFILGDFEGAQEWSLRIYNIGRSEQRRDIQFINKVFQIIIRFELGHLSHLDTEIKNTVQNLRDHGQLDKTNQIILQWLAKLVKNRQENVLFKEKIANNEKLLFSGFRDELLAEKANNSNRQIMGLDEVLMWLEKKMALAK